MPKRARRSRLARPLLLLALALAACAPPGAPTGGGTAARPRRGGSVVDGVQGAAASLMPQQAIGESADAVEAAIWAPLFYTDDRFRLNAGLASAVPSAANGGIRVTKGAGGAPDTESITIKLRPNLKWSDGQLLTAADVLYAIGLFSNPAYGAKGDFAGAAGEIAYAAAPDPTTVVLGLNRVDAAFLATYLSDAPTFAPLPRHVFGALAPTQVAATSTPRVVSGPFTIAAAVTGDRITVVRNPTYYQAPRPYLDQVTFTFYPDAGAIAMALHAGQVTTAYALPPAAAAALRGVRGYALYRPASGPDFEAFYFNLSNPILADPAVRLALAQAFDPEREIARVEGGDAVATCDDSTGTFAHEPGLVAAGGLCPYGPGEVGDPARAKVDPAAAGRLLDQDGWTIGSDGYRHKGGQTLELRLSTASNRQDRLDSERLALAAWNAIGVEVDLDNFPESQLFGSVLFPGDAQYATGNDQWDIAEFEDSTAPDPDSHLYWGCGETPPAGGNNLTYYCNQAMDRLEARQLAQLDPSARAATFHQIHLQLLRDIPLLYLYSPLDLSAYRTTLRNYLPAGLSVAGTGPAETWNVWDWYLG